MKARYFSKVLIANRGEIACRIIRTLNRMGIRSVAVYSDADRNALHVEMADEAIHIGGPSSSESYLNIPRILAAAQQCNADAIHPGYGFLSENADFAEQCEAKGIRFIGPSATAIRAMGSKSAAKRLMESIGVPLIPGYHGDDQSEARLVLEAEKIGFPVLLKAAMGGGGKGMRVVHAAEDLPHSIASCRREALASFSDDHLLIEKYIECPRHVEVQIFCDEHGNAVHLFERDCSIQRRHQKIIEECPAPDLPEHIRTGLHRDAIAAAKSIQYTGAGTVEFLYDGRAHYYFMEMNTRLQVEHPVTEMITGQDLVEWQILVAQSLPLPLRQDEIVQNGHSIEVRICAENPANDFMPSIGQFQILCKPERSSNIRLDSGVRDADTISIYYDSMIAKLITWDKTRDGAIRRMRQALEHFCVSGIETNISYLYQLVSNADFQQCKLATNFIAVNQHTLQLTAPLSDQHVAVAALHEHLSASIGDASDEWRFNRNWRANSNKGSIYRYGIDGKITEAIVAPAGVKYDVSVGNSHFQLEATNTDSVLRVAGSFNGTYRIFQKSDQTLIFSECFCLSLKKTLLTTGAEKSDSARKLTSPMPGVISTILVERGQAVKRGQPLVVMEAMKMEHVIRANRDGEIMEVFCAAGETVGSNFVLVELFG